MQRKTFLQHMGWLSAGGLLPFRQLAFTGYQAESPFARRLKPVGRALEIEGRYVWCNSPIEGPDGRIHVFFSNWEAARGMSGWIRGSEIAHAVADTPESPFQVLGTVLAPRPGYWDATTCHNPLITRVDDTWCLFYMGNSNGKTDTKQIGLATAKRLDGPWTRPDQPLLLPGPAGAWDDHCTTNPAFVKRTNGEYWLYYKSWNTQEYQQSTHPTIRGNRKYGLAIAKQLHGPYVKYSGNPVIDFSGRGDNAQFEDAFIWQQDQQLNMIARDMGVYGHQQGIIMQSEDGLHWTDPKIAYYGADKYIQQPPAPPHLKKYGRFERPQVLLQQGKPTFLFTTSQGGSYMTASAFIFKIV